MTPLRPAVTLVSRSELEDPPTTAPPGRVVVRCSDQYDPSDIRAEDVRHNHRVVDIGTEHPDQVLEVAGLHVNAACLRLHEAAGHMELTRYDDQTYATTDPSGVDPGFTVYLTDAGRLAAELPADAGGGRRTCDFGVRWWALEVTVPAEAAAALLVSEGFDQTAVDHYVGTWHPDDDEELTLREVGVTRQRLRAQR